MTMLKILQWFTKKSENSDNSTDKPKGKRLQIFVAVILTLTLVAGVPFVINECYKAEDGYITKWDAADVLSYYGTVVAAIIGAVGVYFTVYISNKNYREDARNRVLPYIAIDMIDVIAPDPFLMGLENESFSSVGNDPIIEKSLNCETKNHLFFVIDGKSKIRAAESLHDDEVEKVKMTSVTWIIAAKDGKMYVRGSEYVSMPFNMENIGNGPAKKLRMAFSYKEGKKFFKTEILLKQNESFYIHIFSEKSFDEIKGDYIFSVYYEDISGNAYEQVFPVEIVKENENRYNRIDTNGVQHLIGRAK